MKSRKGAQCGRALAKYVRWPGFDPPPRNLSHLPLSKGPDMKRYHRWTSSPQAWPLLRGSELPNHKWEAQSCLCQEKGLLCTSAGHKDRVFVLFPQNFSLVSVGYADEWVSLGQVCSGAEQSSAALPRHSVIIFPPVCIQKHLEAEGSGIYLSQRSLSRLFWLWNKQTVSGGTVVYRFKNHHHLTE